MKDSIKLEIYELRENSDIAYIASIDEEGYPQIKGMFVLEHENVRIQYFSTNLSSNRVKQFLENEKSSVYYCNNKQYKGALFTGKMEVCTDYETKALLWREGFERYYQNGVDDEDYCVLKFTAEKVNYYYGLTNITISMEDY